MSLKCWWKNTKSWQFEDWLLFLHLRLILDLNAKNTIILIHVFFVVGECLIFHWKVLPCLCQILSLLKKKCAHVSAGWMSLIVLISDANLKKWSACLSAVRVYINNIYLVVSCIVSIFLLFAFVLKMATKCSSATPYVVAGQDRLAVTVRLMKSGSGGNNSKRDATAKKKKKRQQAEEKPELKKLR